MKALIKGKMPKDEIWRARAMAMLQRRIYGSSYKAIAEEFNTTEKVVKDSLQYVKANKLVEVYEKSILDLVPDAIRVYRDKLVEDNDPYVAKDVIDKVIKLGDRFANQSQHNQKMGLAAYLAESVKNKRERVIDVTAERVGTGATDGTDGNVQIDAEGTSTQDFENPNGFELEAISDALTEGETEGQPPDE